MKITVKKGWSEEEEGNFYNDSKCNSNCYSNYSRLIQLNIQINLSGNLLWLLKKLDMPN